MPGRPRRRNTEFDRQFIRNNLTEMRVVDGLLVWSGRTEDIGSEYHLPPDDLRCTKLRVMHDDDGGQLLNLNMEPLRQRCMKWAIINSHLCIDHAQGSQAVQQAVKAKILTAADAIAGALITIALDPQEKAAERIKAISTLLDRAGIRAGVEISGEIKGWQAVLKTLMDDESGDDEANA